MICPVGTIIYIAKKNIHLSNRWFEGETTYLNLPFFPAAAAEALPLSAGPFFRLRPLFAMGLSLK